MKQDFRTLYDFCPSNEKPTVKAIETFGAQGGYEHFFHLLWGQHKNIYISLEIISIPLNCSSY